MGWVGQAIHCYVLLLLSVCLLIYLCLDLLFHLFMFPFADTMLVPVSDFVCMGWVGQAIHWYVFFYSLFIYFLVYLCFDLFISFIYVSICRHNVGPSLRLCMHGVGWAGHPWCWSHVSNIPLPGTLLSREPLTMSAETKTEIKLRMRRIEGPMAHACVNLKHPGSLTLEAGCGNN